MSNPYPYGETIQLSATFSVAPGTVVLKIKTPDGAVHSYTPTGTTNAYYNYLPTQVGSHIYRFEGTGGSVTGTATHPDKRFNVRPTTFV